MSDAGYLSDCIDTMRLLRNEEGQLVFPHLDAECLEAMAKVWRADPETFNGMGPFEALTRAYSRAVRTSHRGMN